MLTALLKDTNMLNEAKKNDTAYPISANGFWHNGIHISSTKALHNTYDGTVVALRLSDSYENCYVYDKIHVQWLRLIFKNIPDTIEEFFDLNGDMYTLKTTLTDAQKNEAYKFTHSLFSHNFVLICHQVQTLSGTAIIFYSLIMHMRPLNMLTLGERIPLIWYEVLLKKKTPQFSGVQTYKNVQRTIAHKILPGETLVTVDTADNSKITWTLNGIHDSGYIKPEHYRSVNGHYETKRVGTGENNLNEAECTKENGIVLYSSCDSSNRLAYSVVPPQTVLTGSGEELVAYTSLTQGVSVSFMDNGVCKKAFVYADYTEQEKTAFPQICADCKKNTASNAVLKAGDLEISVKLVKGIKSADVSCPSDTAVRSGQIIGYADYQEFASEKRIETSNVHYEVFTPDVGFMTSDKKEEYPCTYEVRSSCTAYTQKPKSNVQTKNISITGKVYVKLTESGSFTDADQFYKLTILADVIDNTHYIKHSDLGAWNKDRGTYRGRNNSEVSLYSAAGELVAGTKTALYADFHYKWSNQVDDIKINGVSTKLRRVAYLYTKRDDEVSFWIDQNTFNTHLKQIGEDTHYIIMQTIPASQIYDTPSGVTFAGAKTLTSGSLTNTAMRVTEYTAINKKTKKESWLCMKGTEILWVKESDIKTGKDSTPIERILYNDWLYFFTRLDNVPSEYHISDFTKLIKDKNDLQQELSAALKQNIETADTIPFGRTVNDNPEAFAYLSHLVYKRESEWKKDDNLTKALGKMSQTNKKRIEIERDKLVFWDDATSLNSKRFPSSSVNWYFYPVHFLNHLMKVAVPPEFNPYEGMTYEEIYGKSSLPKEINGSQKIMDNPGFAPVWMENKNHPINPNCNGYACVTGLCNENYALAGGLDYKDWSHYYHEGVDFRGTSGTSIQSFIQGTVLAYGWFGTYGRTIFIARRNQKGIYLLAHLNSFDEKIRVGAIIKPLDAVGTVGRSGIKEGKDRETCWDPHLHITYFDYGYINGVQILIGNGGNITKTTEYTNKVVNKKYNPFKHDDRKLEND